MAGKHLWIESVERFPESDANDSLVFVEGVNVIVGDLNAGKTTWLQMVDFLFGDNGGPEQAFDEELVKKYEGIKATIHIGEKEYTIERNWKTPGAKTKTFVDGEPHSVKEFSRFMLEELEIPLVTVPSGNPYADRTWPELSFRDVFRHMYKQERMWSDVVEKQNEVVRSAVLLQFFKKAKSVYSDEYGELVSKQKQRDKIEAQKAVYSNILQNVAVELVKDPGMSVAITADSLGNSKKILEEKIKEVEKKKNAWLEKHTANLEDKKLVDFDTVGKNIRKLMNQLDALIRDKMENDNRVKELKTYEKTLNDELSRFNRATDAARVLSDLKITHCPACDQEVPQNRHVQNICNLCGQEEHGDADVGSSGKRIFFEKAQIKEELKELGLQIKELDSNIISIDSKIEDLKGSLNTEQMKLRNVEALSVIGLPPEIAALDMKLGSFAEKMEQLMRVGSSLKERERYDSDIEKLDEQIVVLEKEIKELAPNVNYSELSDTLSDKMNTYINAVNIDDISRWKTGRVTANLKRDSFKMLLDNQAWTVKAGGTKNYVIQLAYHYAVLSLSKEEEFDFPGLLIIDFPPHFAKADDLKGSENYLLRPFIELCSERGMSDTQVIVAGRAFEGLKGANTIVF
ncbi:MAG: hypothetical protein OQL19_07105 [Gammaproteobacteria bacterium]|nr:hypothetical protein [Gammaproteobacteria bacterium]